MKKVTMLICTALLLCGLGGIASATIWTDPVTIGAELSGTDSYEWTHALPGIVLSFPPDTVNSASLAITARRATESNDLMYYYVELDDTYLGFLLAGSGNSEQVTTFPLGTLFVNSMWDAGALLNFRLDYSQPTGPGQSEKMTLVSSLFTLDYTKFGDGNNGGGGQDNGAVVPEPSTVVLLGSGLLGLIYVGRKRSRK